MDNPVQCGVSVGPTQLTLRGDSTIKAGVFELVLSPMAWRHTGCLKAAIKVRATNAGGTVESPTLAAEILAYLSQHPDARDTLEGIAQWWLLEQQIKRTLADVKETVAALVADRLIVSRCGADGRTYFGVNPRKLGQIRALMAKSGGERGRDTNNQP